MSSASRISIPFTCPACAEKKGVPVGLAAEGANQVVAVIRCQSCRHFWQMRRPRHGSWPVPQPAGAGHAEGTVAFKGHVPTALESGSVDEATVEMPRRS